MRVPLVKQLFDCELNRHGERDTDNDAAKENCLRTKIIHTAALLSISTTSEWHTVHMHAGIQTNARMPHGLSEESGQ